MDDMCQRRKIDARSRHRSLFPPRVVAGAPQITARHAWNDTMSNRKNNSQSSKKHPSNPNPISKSAKCFRFALFGVHLVTATGARPSPGAARYDWLVGLG